MKGQCSAGEPEPDPWTPTLAASRIASNSGPENLVENSNNNLITKSFAFLGGIFGKKSATAEAPAKVEIVNCDDYYRGDSVTFEDVSVKTNSVKAGDTVNFKLKVKNTNDYPIADGSVYVKIYRLKNNAKPSESHYLAEAFKAVSGVNLWAGEEKDLEFNWEIPQGLLGGKYKTALFFVSSDQYNLNGLSFTPGVFGASLSLNIAGEEKGFWFDSNNIKINDGLINSATATPVLSDGKKVLVSFPLESTLGKGSANISVDLYDFDFLNEKSKIEKEHQEIIVPLTPVKQDLQFIFENLEPGTYAAKISADGENQKSMAEIRFSIPGDKGRFVFTGISGFPIQKGQDNAIFSCFSTAVDLYSSFPASARIELRERDTGKIIAGINLSAVINPNKLGVKKVFKAPINSENLVLVSMLFDRTGKLMNEVRTDYTLTDFSQVAATNKGLTVKIIVLVAALLVFLAVLIVLFKKIIFAKKNIFKPKNLVLLLLVLGAWASLSISVQGLDFQGLFQCIGGDQPCCQALYDGWGQSAPFIQVEKKIEGLVAEHSAWKEFSLTNLSTNAGSPTNVSNSGSINILDDAPQPTGEFEYGVGWIGTPFINWLEDTGIEGGNVYYSAGIPPRLCANPANTPANLPYNCPPGGDQYFIGDKGAFNYWCNNTNKPRYEDANFNLLTDTMWFTGANFPESYLYGDEACIGISVNCDRTEYIQVTGPLECTLTNSVTGDNCTATAELGCNLKGVHVTSTCESTGVGPASITTSHSFNCFAYMDKGVFVQTQDGREYFWETGQAGNTDFECAPQGQKCWCEGWKKETQIVAQQCAQLAQPLKLISTDPIGVTQSAFSKTYYVNIVNSQVPFTGYIPPGSLISVVGDVVLEEGDFRTPGIVTYEFNYSDLYVGLEGTPTVDTDPNDADGDATSCGAGGVVVGGSCTNPGGDNPNGTCAIQCQYDNPDVGIYTAHFRIENTEKFAVTDVTIKITSSDNLPSAIKLNSTPVDCCFHTDVAGSFGWTFSDPDAGDTQNGYQVQVSSNNNFSSVYIDSCVSDGNYVLSNTCETGGGSQSFAPNNRPFDWNTYYYWRVKVKDSTGNWSAWAYQPNDPDISPFPTLSYTSSGSTAVRFYSNDPWPWPEFNFSVFTPNLVPPPDGTWSIPQSCDRTNCYSSPFLNVFAPLNTIVELTNMTETSNGAPATNHPEYCTGVNDCSYEWSFGDGETSASLNPADHGYGTKGAYQLKLSASNVKTYPGTNSLTHSCDIYLNLSVGEEKPPKWHEIPPFSMLEEALAAVSNFLNF